MKIDVLEIDHPRGVKIGTAESADRALLVFTTDVGEAPLEMQKRIFDSGASAWVPVWTVSEQG